MIHTVYVSRFVLLTGQGRRIDRVTLEIAQWFFGLLFSHFGKKYIFSPLVSPWLWCYRHWWKYILFRFTTVGATWRSRTDWLCPSEKEACFGWFSDVICTGCADKSSYYSLVLKLNSPRAAVQKQRKTLTLKIKTISYISPFSVPSCSFFHFDATVSETTFTVH